MLEPPAAPEDPDEPLLPAAPPLLPSDDPLEPPEAPDAPEDPVPMWLPEVELPERCFVSALPECPDALEPVPDVVECDAFLSFLCFFFAVAPLFCSVVALPLVAAPPFVSAPPLEPEAVSDAPLPPACPPTPGVLPPAEAPGAPVPDSLPVAEVPVPPMDDDPDECCLARSLSGSFVVDDEPPEEPPLIDEPGPPEPALPPVLLCADATPTPSAASAPAKNNRSLSLISKPPRARARRA